ncbi:MAG: NAD(P)H-quinone oxidoreductase [Clostridia bacterium]|nr:NAD(P)H-quinone oxidoreductase [Clostridia bacterium]
MKAILVNPDKSLVWTDVPTPVPADDEVLVEICCAALNRADLMQRDGDYPPPPGCPEWMGLEISGYVRELGKTAQKMSGWKIGDAVCALLGGGGYAQYVTVKYDMLMPVPKGRTMEEAAAIPEAYCTSYLNLFIEGGAKAGDTLLMQAGASGLASVVIPMAKAFGLRVITTVISDEMAERIKPLGADIIVNTAKEALSDVLRAQLEAGTPVDIAIDCLGGASMGSCLPYLARGARWIMIAALTGQITEIDLKNIYVRNVRIIGSTLRSRTPEFKAELLRKLVAEVFPKMEQGLIPPFIYRVLPITEAETAHAIMAEGKHNGKIVMTVPHD